MNINFKSSNEGLCQPRPATELDVEKLEEILEKCYNLQPELSEAGIYVNCYGSLDFDTTIDIQENVYDLLNNIDIIIN